MATPIPQAEFDAMRAGLTTIAVTGTNGKTSTVGMLASIVQAAGQVPVRVTTLGMWVGDEQTAEDGSMASFVRTMARARERGARTLALEVTSRALAGGFASRWPANIAVFTNFTRDHLDRHGTPEEYLAAKAQLFVGPRRPRTAVLNLAEAASALLAEVIGVGPPVCRGFLPAGRAAQCPLPIALGATRVETGEGGTRVQLDTTPGAAGAALATALSGALTLPVLGDFQGDNAMAAALSAHEAGFSPQDISAGLARFAGVPGRFEVITRAPLSVVDFAHSPDALSRVLESARTMAERRGGRLGCVFGCGGERDADKRPRMGEVADRLADAVWLTTDNPRGEAPTAIAAMIRQGIGRDGGRARWQEVPDRRAAIAAAASWASPRDVVVVAGRGHERIQHLSGGDVELLDRDVVRAAFAPAT